MTNGISPEEAEAKKLEEKARQHVRYREYDAALALYEKAMDTYARMGWQGQVGILKKEVERIQAMRKFLAESAPVAAPKSDPQKAYELEKSANNLLKKAQEARSQQQLQESLDNYKQALQIFEGLAFDYQVQKIRGEIQKLEQQIKGGGVAQTQSSIAEEGVERIEQERMLQDQKHKIQETMRERERLEESKRREQVIPQKEAPISTPEKGAPVSASKPPVFVSEQRRAQLERMKELDEKRKREKEIETKAFDLMDQAKKHASQGKFTEARNLYLESIKILERGNWTNQIDIVKREISELRTREEEFRKKEEHEKLRKTAQERDFQTKVQDLQRKTEMEEKERVEARRKNEEKRKMVQEEIYRQREQDIRKEKEKFAKVEEEKRKAKSPEYLKKVQLAEMTLAKAQKFEGAGKPDLALDRYNYLLELYKELEYSPEMINQINEIIKKLKPS